ncbi:MAG: hypothetical protein PUB34_06950 [Clostridia bacterium]|nr:hypothetical protein [Clostridia bacterium]
MKKPFLKLSGLSIGYIVLSFGLGMLITYFIPPCILVILEAIIIIIAGLLCLIGK